MKIMKKLTKILWTQVFMNSKDYKNMFKFNIFSKLLMFEIKEIFFPKMHELE